MNYLKSTAALLLQIRDSFESDLSFDGMPILDNRVSELQPGMLK